MAFQNRSRNRNRQIERIEPGPESLETVNLQRELESSTTYTPISIDGQIFSSFIFSFQSNLLLITYSLIFDFKKRCYNGWSITNGPFLHISFHHSWYVVLETKIHHKMQRQKFYNLRCTTGFKRVRFVLLKKANHIRSAFFNAKTTRI